MKRVVDERSGPPQRGRSGERPTSSRSQQSESNNHTNQNQRRNWNKTKETAPIAEVTPPIEANRTTPRIG